MAIVHRFCTLERCFIHPITLFHPARFPLERNRSSGKTSRKIEKLERILVAKVCQLLRNSL